MKTYRLFITVVLVVFSLTISAQIRLSPNDSIMYTAKVKVLTEKRAKLKKQIDDEDAKRNQVVNGVTPEVQESLNDEQDSICLELRSQLVAVELELKELVPDTTITNVVKQLNLLKENQQSNSGSSVEGKK